MIQPAFAPEAAPTDASAGKTSTLPSPVPFLRSAKELVLRVANRSGFSHALASSNWRQQRLLVLCYHGVSQLDEHEWSDLYISPERLEQRLERLRKLSTTVMPLDKALDGLHAGDLPQRSVCLTFDDGACDFSRLAVPLLAAADVHSTVYLTTYYCRKHLPVFNPFASYLLWKGRGRTVLIPGIETRVTIPLYTNDRAFRALHARVVQHARDAGMDAEAKNEYARLIAAATHADFAALMERRILHLMNPAEVRALDPERVSVQLHTHRHRLDAPFSQFREELARNAAEIAEMTGRADHLPHFCYPSGMYSAEFIEWVRLCGMRSATTCQPNYCTSQTSHLEIPRFVDTMNVTPDTFDAWVMGSAAFTLRKR